MYLKCNLRKMYNKGIIWNISSNKSIQNGEKARNDMLWNLYNKGHYSKQIKTLTSSVMKKTNKWLVSVEAIRNVANMKNHISLLVKNELCSGRVVGVSLRGYGDIFPMTSLAYWCVFDTTWRYISAWPLS